MYRGRLDGARVLDVGCGSGLSSFYFSLNGAQVNFSDVIEDNVKLMECLCKLRRIKADFLHSENEASLARLPRQYDWVLAIGSLLHAPLENIRREVQAILPSLRDGARWLHFAYPKTRWEDEGRKPFSEWGNYTDGLDTPWTEYHD